jgi:ribosomal protein S18 acetylase RimI-like enzyme
MIIRGVRPEDGPALVALVQDHFTNVHQQMPLFAPWIDLDTLGAYFSTPSPFAFVGEVDGRPVSFLYARELNGELWLSPEACVFHDDEQLGALVAALRSAAQAESIRLMHVIAPHQEELVSAWNAVGFSSAEYRGVVPTARRPRSAFRLQKARSKDVPALLELFEQFVEIGDEAATGQSPSAAITARLRHGETAFLVVRRHRRAIAQILTFPLRVTGIPKRTQHISGVAVLPAFQRQGVATAMINATLTRLHRRRWRYASVSWDAGNEPADALWRSAGFAPTLVRLRSALAD